MKLPSRMVAKVWGRRDLPSPFDRKTAEPVGEVWFEPPSELSDILVKYLFTTQKLSVQVHPDDACAPEGSSGKEECWLVLDAEPGARLAVGFCKPVDCETMRTAAIDGSIESLLNWREVAPGDWFQLPPGTVHAIGAGLTILEVQQNSDITYRLYDYGRDRSLHLDEAIAVASRSAHPAALSGHLDPHESASIGEPEHFRVTRMSGDPSSSERDLHPGPVQLLPLEGDVKIGGEAIRPGESGAALSLDEVDFTAAVWTVVISSR